MSELDGLLAGIASEPEEETRWLVLADWLEENDDPRRSELLRLHRRLIATCCEPYRSREQVAWQTRLVELLGQGVRPCVPQESLPLPGGKEMTFSFIPPGTFRMGSDRNDVGSNENPVHVVTLTKGFYLGTHPVTQAQWKAVMGTAPGHFKGPNRPVERVTWEQCQEFCKSLTAGQRAVRLPTEAEWEYACRAGTTTEYHFGDPITTNLANYDGNYSWNGSPKGEDRARTTDVDSFPANAWGLFDVHGNVWEWCEDWYAVGYYATSPAQDPVCANHRTGDRVIRGGAWYYYPNHCRSASRAGFGPAGRDNRIGVRVSFSLD